MKRKLSLTLIGASLGVALSLLAGCGATSAEFDTSKQIDRYTRDTTSGTRDGYFTATGFKEAIKDDSKLPNASIVTGNDTMMLAIKNDIYGFGYISLSTLESSKLKGLKYNGVEPSEANVVSGDYKLSRNFNYITRQTSDLDETKQKLIKAFLGFMNSKEGLSIIKGKDGILTMDLASAESFATVKANDADIAEVCAATGDKVTIKFGGSTSVENIAKALTAAFAEQCAIFSPIHNHTGSGDAYKCTQGSEKDGANALDVGFLSRELEDNEAAAEGTSGFICKDGIVSVVNSANTSLENLTAEEIKTIYSSESISWAELAK